MICHKRRTLNHNKKKEERFRRKVVKSLTVKDSLEDNKNKRTKVNLGGKNSAPGRTKNLNLKKLLQILKAYKINLNQGLLGDKLKLMLI